MTTIKFNRTTVISLLYKLNSAVGFGWKWQGPVGPPNRIQPPATVEIHKNGQHGLERQKVGSGGGVV